MKFNCTVGNLRNALDKAAIAIHDKPMIAVRAYARITVAKGGPKPVRITGSNDHMNVVAAVEYIKIDAPGEALVHPAPLRGLLATLPADETIDLETTDTHLRVTRAGGSPYTFLLEAGDYPDPIEVRDKKSSVNLDFLPQALNAAKRSMDPDTKVIRLKSTEDNVSLYSTDGSRLTQVVATGYGFGDLDTVLSSTALEAIVKVNPSVVAFDRKAVNATSDEASLTVRSENIQFQDFTPVLSKVPNYAVTIDRKDLQEKLKRLHAVDPSAVVTLGINNDGIVMALSRSIATYGQESIVIEEGPEELISISINLEYLRDAVSSHVSPEVRIGFSGPKEPVLIKSNFNRIDTISVIMPVG